MSKMTPLNVCSIKKAYHMQPSRALRHNDQAHPPPEAEATGGTTKAQAVGGRVQRLVLSLVNQFSSRWMCKLVAILLTHCYRGMTGQRSHVEDEFMMSGTEISSGSLTVCARPFLATESARKSGAVAYLRPPISRVFSKLR